MAAQDPQFRELEKAVRWRKLRNWALCLGLVAFLLAGVAGWLVGADNLIDWSSASVAIAEGLLRWSIAPLLAAGVALIFAAALAHGLSRWGHGEV